MCSSYSRYDDLGRLLGRDVLLSEYQMTGRSQPQEKGPRQQDSKCKDPAKGTSMLCIRNGKKAHEQSAYRGEGQEMELERSQECVLYRL